MLATGRYRDRKRERTITRERKKDKFKSGPTELSLDTIDSRLVQNNNSKDCH